MYSVTNIRKKNHTQIYFYGSLIFYESRVAFYTIKKNNVILRRKIGGSMLLLPTYLVLRFTKLHYYDFKHLMYNTSLK